MSARVWSLRSRCKSEWVLGGVLCAQFQRCEPLLGQRVAEPIVRTFLP